MHVVGAGDLGQGLARVTAGQRLSLLMRGEPWLAPEMHAPRPGPLPAFPCARPDQFTLELGETTQGRSTSSGHAGSSYPPKHPAVSESLPVSPQEPRGV